METLLKRLKVYLFAIIVTSLELLEIWCVVEIIKNVSQIKMEL